MGEPHLWAQVGYLVLAVVGLLVSANRHGKSTTTKHDFWSDSITTAIVLTLMYFAGAFSLIF